MASKRTLDTKMGSRPHLYMIACGVCGRAGGATIHYVGKMDGKAVYTCTNCLKRVAHG